MYVHYLVLGSPLLRRAGMVLCGCERAVVSSETQRPSQNQVVGQAEQAPGIYRILIVLSKYPHIETYCVKSILKIICHCFPFKDSSYSHFEGNFRLIERRK